MYLVLGSRSERGGARRAPTKRVLFKNKNSLQNVEKFLPLILELIINDWGQWLKKLPLDSKIHQNPKIFKAKKSKSYCPSKRRLTSSRIGFHYKLPKHVFLFFSVFFFWKILRETRRNKTNWSAMPHKDARWKNNPVQVWNHNFFSSKRYYLAIFYVILRVRSEFWYREEYPVNLFFFWKVPIQ